MSTVVPARTAVITGIGLVTPVGLTLDEVFDAATFANRFKQLLPLAEGPHLVTGRHFLQEDSAPEIADLIRSFLDRLDKREAAQ